MIGPRLDVQIEVGADHGAEQLNGAFLHRIGGRAEPSGEIAIEAMGWRRRRARIRGARRRNRRWRRGR